MKLKRISQIAFGVILCVLTSVIVWQGQRVKDLEKAAETQKEAAITEVENRYKDSLKLSGIRFDKLTAKYDSVTTVKTIKKNAIKLNKTKADAKILYINTANDSLLLFVTDSNLRANGFNR